MASSPARRPSALVAGMAVIVCCFVLGTAVPASAAPAARPATSRQSSAPQPSAPGGRGYVAMGDSYSSGLGTKVYYRGTSRGRNQCHRSPLAYGPLLRATQHLRQQLSFVACSGARTADLYRVNHESRGEPAQLEALAPATADVSLTIGGNDLGFFDVSTACVQTLLTSGYGCSRRPGLSSTLSRRLAALAGLRGVPDPDGVAITPVATVLTDISRRSPDARIYLAGYPELFGHRREDFARDSSAPSGSACKLNPLLRARIDYADAQWFNSYARRLNAVLRQAVEQAQREGVRVSYVPVPAFAGHGLCDQGEAWIRPVLVGITGVKLESLHPSSTGQAQGYAPALRRAGLLRPVAARDAVPVAASLRD